MFSSSNNATDDEAFDSSGPSLEIDSDERDSAFGDTDSTLTMSVTESVYDYKYENGRRYHAYSEGKYPVPNDEVEKDRLDLQHHAFRLMLDGALYRAPIPPDVQNVLDVGTGTGIWAIEFAEEHPSAKVLGTDLSPIQPTVVPPNCSFLVDDCDQEWVFREKFDYIHTRAMVAALKDWDRFLQQAFANLKPGGYIELQEITFPAMCTDPTMTPETSPLLRWSALFTEAAAKIGIDASGPLKLGPKLRNAGFVDIHAKQFKWPVGRWAKGEKMKLLGRFAFEDLMDWLPSSALGLFTRVLQWSREEVEIFLATVRKELKEEKRRHFYANVVVWYAQKPDNTGTVNFDGDVVNEEQELESDEERTVRSRDVARDNGADAQELQSPGELAESTADLTLSSPLHAPSKESITPAPKKPQSSVEAFRDSVLSLAAEATAHAATADVKVESEPEPQIQAESNHQQLNIKESIIHDSLRRSNAVSESSSIPSVMTEAAVSEPPQSNLDKLVKAEESARTAESSATEHPSSLRRDVSHPDFASALGPTTIMPIMLPEPEIKTTSSAFYHETPEPIEELLPALKHDFGFALGPTSIQRPLEPESKAATAPTSSIVPEISKDDQVTFHPNVELEVDEDEGSDVDVEERIANILGRRRAL